MAASTVRTKPPASRVDLWASPPPPSHPHCLLPLSSPQWNVLLLSPAHPELCKYLLSERRKNKNEAHRNMKGLGKRVKGGSLGWGNVDRLGPGRGGKDPQEQGLFRLHEAASKPQGHNTKAPTFIPVPQPRLVGQVGVCLRKKTLRSFDSKAHVLPLKTHSLPEHLVLENAFCNSEFWKYRMLRIKSISTKITL